MATRIGAALRLGVLGIVAGLSARVLWCQTMPAAGKLEGDLFQICALSDGTIVLRTEHAIYFADDATLTRWTSKVSVAGEHVDEILEGTADRIVFLGHAFNPALAGVNLRVWTPQGGFATVGTEGDLKMLIPGCKFVDANRGVHFDSTGIVVTVDGGKTWLPRKDLFPELDYVEQVEWISKDSFLVGSSEGILLRLKMDDQGKLEQQWSARVPPRAYSVSQSAGYVWVAAGSGLRVLDARDGRLVTDAEVPLQGTRVVASGDVAYLVGEGSLNVWQIKDKKLKRLSETRIAGNRIAVLPQGLFKLDMKTLSRFNPDTNLFEVVETTANNQPLRGAEEKLRVSRGMPTQVEMQAMMQLAGRFSPAIQTKVMKPIMDRKDLTMQERVRLVTEEFKKLLAEQNGGAETKP